MKRIIYRVTPFFGRFKAVPSSNHITVSAEIGGAGLYYISYKKHSSSTWRDIAVEGNDVTVRIPNLETDTLYDITLVVKQGETKHRSDRIQVTTGGETEEIVFKAADGNFFLSDGGRLLLSN